MTGSPVFRRSREQRPALRMKARRRRRGARGLGGRIIPEIGGRPQEQSSVRRFSSMALRYSLKLETALLCAVVLVLVALGHMPCAKGIGLSSHAKPRYSVASPDLSPRSNIMRPHLAFTLPGPQQPIDTDSGRKVPLISSRHGGIKQYLHCPK